MKTWKPCSLFAPLLAVIAIALVSAPANAQTGPTGPPQGGVQLPQVNALPAPSNLLTPKLVADYLRKQNHKVEIRQAKGGPLVLAHIQQEGWGFDIEIQYTADLRSFFLHCPLSKSNVTLSTAQSLALLKAIHQFSPGYFLIRPGDQRLCYEDYFGAQMNTTGFQRVLNHFLGTIRTSHSLWDSSRWPATDALLP